MDCGFESHRDYEREWWNWSDTMVSKAIGLYGREGSSPSLRTVGVAQLEAGRLFG